MCGSYRKCINTTTNTTIKCVDIHQHTLFSFINLPEHEKQMSQAQLTIRIPQSPLTPWTSLIFFASIIASFSICIFIAKKIYAFRNPFWSIQPVARYTELSYWLYSSPYIISPELPHQTPFSVPHLVTTQTLSDLLPQYKAEFIDFVSTHYLQNGNNKYAPTETNIIPYLEGGTGGNPTFISFYLNPVLSSPTKLIGVMSTHAVTVKGERIKDAEGKSGGELVVYCADYLCVHRDYRHKKVAPCLIQTHEYNQRYLNQQVVVSLFKREEELTSIRPLATYKAKCYRLEDTINRGNEIADPPYYLKRLKGKRKSGKEKSKNVVQHSGEGDVGMAEWWEYLQQHCAEAFQVSVCGSLANVSGLLDTENLLVYVYYYQNKQENKNEVLASFVFRRTCTSLGEGSKCGEVLMLCASTGGKILDTILFAELARKAVEMAVQDLNNVKVVISHLAVEEISCNWQVTSYLEKNKRVKPCLVSKYAYYFYNYWHPEVAAHGLFVLM